MDADTNDSDIATTAIDSMEGLSRRYVLQSAVIAAGTVGLAGCLGDDANAVAADDEDDDEEELLEQWMEEFEPFDLPELDVERAEVEIHGDTLQVEAYDNTWVGEVTDDLFIAFSIVDGDSEQAWDIAAYACDSDETSVYLTGDLEDDEAHLDDCVDTIELSIADSEITGTLTLEEQEPMPFVAVQSTGDAGLYAAETIKMGEIEVTIRWVVLADGRQRGGRKCRNPWTGDCMWCPVPK